MVLRDVKPARRTLPRHAPTFIQLAAVAAIVGLFYSLFSAEVHNWTVWGSALMLLASRASQVYFQARLLSTGDMGGKSGDRQADAGKAASQAIAINSVHTFSWHPRTPHEPT